MSVKSGKSGEWKKPHEPRQEYVQTCKFRGKHLLSHQVMSQEHFKAQTKHSD